MYSFRSAAVEFGGAEPVCKTGDSTLVYSLFKSRLVGFVSELTTNSTGESRLCYVLAD